MPVRHLLCLLLICCCLPVAGRDYHFRHLTTAEGLLSDLRLVMTEDNYGRLWIGSDEGINVFDGKELLSYSLPDNSGLLSNGVQQIFCDRANTIWIKGTRGVQYKRESDSRFRTLDEGNTDLNDTYFFDDAPDSALFAFAAAGIYRVDRDLKVNRLKSFDALLAEYRRPLSICHFGGDTWLLGCTKKILVIDMRRQRLLKVLDWPQAWCMARTADSTIMAGSFARSQLSLVNIYTGAMTHINNWKTDDGQPIGGYAGTIAPIGNNRYALACRTYGVYIVDVAAQSAQHLVHHPADPASLKSNFCRRLYVTRSGNLFAHTAGLSYTPLAQTQFHTIKKVRDENGVAYDEGFNSFLAAPDGTMWLATNRFLVHWNRKTNISRFYPFYDPQQGPLFFKTVRAVVADKQNRVWVGTFGGGIGMLQGNGSYKILVPGKDREHSLPSREIHAIAKDRDGNFLICANGGFAFFDPLRGHMETFINRPELKAIAGKTTYYALADARNNWWLGQEDGVFYYDRERDTVMTIDMPAIADRSVRSLAQDNEGNTYVGCKSGVYIIARGGYAVTDSLDKSDGLTSEFVVGLIKDRGGNIWILGNRGLARYNLPGKKLEAFNAKDGLEQSNHPLCTYYLAPDGEMFIGTSEGFNHFYPEDIKEQQHRVNVFVSSVELQDTIINFPSDAVLNLRYFQNNISFNYQAVDYNLASYIQYRYRMQGFDSLHVYAGAQRKARYTNMPAGDYTFVAEASINGKDWQAAATPVHIYIRKAVWRTLWFQLGVLLLLLGGLYAWYRYRIRIIDRRARVRTAYEVKMNEMENSALRTQMNPHFIFNSLNTINAFINANDSAQANRYISKFSKLIRLILDHSRMKIISLSEELESLELYVQIEQIRFEHRFAWHIDIDPAIDPSETEIPSLIIQPFVENAILHGLLPLQQGGQLTVSLVRKDDHMLCVIEDNGIGRDQAMADKKHRPARHKSHGLDITLRRIEFFNKEHGLDMEPQITDLYHADGTAAGTRVVVPLAYIERF